MTNSEKDALVPSRRAVDIADEKYGPVGGTDWKATGDDWTPEDIKEMRAKKLPFLCHYFELACADLDIEHRLTKPRHPWTNG